MEDKAYLLALKYLNIRPRSEKEIREYIKKKQKKYPDISSSMADLIVHKLKQQRFLDDKSFAEWLVRSRTEFKPRGKYVVEQELRQKGISQEIIDEVFASNRSKSEDDLATEALTVKKRRYEHMEPRERFSKAGSMLARRGFSLDAIKTAIDRVFGKMV